MRPTRSPAPSRRTPQGAAMAAAGLALTLLTGCSAGPSAPVAEPTVVSAPAPGGAAETGPVAGGSTPASSDPADSQTADGPADQTASGATDGTTDRAGRRAARAAARALRPPKAVAGPTITRIPKAQRVAMRAEALARRVAAQNPLTGHDWGTYHGSADQAWGPYLAAGPAEKALLSKIVEQPKAQWFGDWIPESQIAGKVGDYIANAQAGDPDALVQLAVFRMSPWEHDACHRQPSGAEQAAYRRWIDAFAAAVGDTPAAIVLQPDGPFALCVPGGPGGPSSDLVAYAARVFGALPNAATYLDAGAADWPAVGQGGVAQVLRFLIPSGVADVRGIALNSTHYSATADEVRRGAEIVDALAAAGITGKKVVINTSSNGRPFVFGDAPGSDPDNATVCASPAATHCVTLGIPPTTDVADPRWGLDAETAALAREHVDAYLWFGRPWLYRQNSPFDKARALQLARTTPY